jgi:hypothetical protein
MNQVGEQLEKRLNRHLPVLLNQAERDDVGSIYKHPGLGVILGKILFGHYQQEMAGIHDIAVDDPDRITKLAATCAVADAMKMTIELLKRELDQNWLILQNQEKERQMKANEGGKTQ